MMTVALMLITCNVYSSAVALVFPPLYGHKFSNEENEWMPHDNWYPINGRRNINPRQYTEDRDYNELYRKDLMVESPSTSNTTRRYRLPDNFYPTLYDIHLQPHIYSDDSRDFFFNGSVRIEMQCTQSTDEIILHSKELKISEQSVVITQIDSTRKMINPTIEYDHEHEFVIVKTDERLERGRVYNIYIDFSGTLTVDLKGLYLSSYKSGNTTRYLVTSQLEATHARVVFPCFDEPAMKARFHVAIVRKRHMTSLSNTHIVRQEDRGDNWVADYYDTTPKMSTYILAFTVCDFNFTSVIENNITFRTWARPELVHETPFALQLSVDLLKYFEDYSNIKFPLTKSDMIAVPDFAYAGMENWGLIVYHESAMLYDPVESPEKDKLFVAMVVSHEVAHQWFGNLVTPSWWGDLWLNEAFASYFDYKALDKLYPDWLVFQLFIYNEAERAFAFDGMVSSRPVYSPGVSTPKQIESTINPIAYQKGACVVRMMHFFLGEDTFRRGLQRYMNAAAYGVATHDDLWYALGNQSVIDNKYEGSVDVKSIMDTWILQKNFPLVTVSRKGNDLILKQSRFLYNQTAVDTGKYTSPFGYKWNIPFTFTTSMQLNFNQTEKDVIWMYKDTTEVLLPDVLSGLTCNDWYIANVMQYGFYRVNYPEENWKNLINQLKTDLTKIHPLNRAQIIHDAWTLFKSGNLNMDIALQTTEYLSNEDNLGPFLAVQRVIGMKSSIDKMLQRTEVYGAFSKFMRTLYKEPFRKFGLHTKATSHVDKLFKQEIVPEACYYGNEECRDYSLRSFKLFMDSNITMDAEFRSVIYCTAIRHGGEDEWDFAYSKYKSSTIPSEKEELMEALACSREVWILNRYLKYTLMPEEIRRQDIDDIITLVSNNPTGQSLAWDFLRTNWEVLVREYELSHRILRKTTKYINTKLDLQSVLDFKTKHPGIDDSYIQQATERIQINVKWMNDTFPIIAAWLSKMEGT